MLRQYRYEQLLEQAYQELKKGATPQANFHLRVLVANFAENDRTYAALSKYASLLNRPEAAAWLERAIELNPQKVDYRLAYTLALLQFNQLVAAEQSVTTWPKEQQDTAAYYQAQAALAFARGHWEQAVPHFEKIIEIKGPLPLHLNNLAKARLQSPEASVARQARETLEAQLADSPFAWQAGRALVQDALRRQDHEQAQHWLVQLRAKPRRAVDQDLFLLEAGSQLGPVYVEQRQADLLAAQERWRHQPEAAARLIGWMATTGQSAEAITWSQSLDPLLQETFPVAFAMGEAKLQLRRVEEVFTAYEKKPWSRHDEQRHLLLARASALQSPELSTTDNLHLQRALELAAREDFGLANLERILRTWRWSAALEPLWWQMLEKRQQVPRALLSLYQLYDAQQNYPRLLELAEFELSLDAKNLAAANNVAYLSLLLEKNRERARELARNFHQRYPNQASLTSTYVLALLDGGQIEQAAELFATLPAPHREKASQRLLQAQVQMANGETTEALKTLESIDVQLLITPERQRFEDIQEHLIFLSQQDKNP